MSHGSRNFVGWAGVLLITLKLIASVQAAAIYGVDWYVGNAQVIALVEGTEEETRADVKSVLKGIYFAQTVELQNHQLTDGQQAVFLIQYQSPGDLYPCIESRHRPPDEKMIWPVSEQGNIDSGDIPSKTTGFVRVPGERVTLDSIRLLIKKQTPEQLELNDDVVLASVMPARLQGSKDRKRYVQIVKTIRDSDRNVSELSLLLESRDQEIAQAAHNRLTQITQRVIPKLEHSRSHRRQLVRKLNEWWDASRGKLAWSETSDQWIVSKHGVGANLRQWPQVPNDFKIPMADSLSVSVRNSFEKGILPFQTAFRRWLDSGVLRDRAILSQTDVDLASSSLTGPYGSPASGPPRLLISTVSDEKLPAAERFGRIALLAADWHHKRFRKEWKATSEWLRMGRPSPDLIKRAVFWEPTDTNRRSPGRVATELLASRPDIKAGEQLAMQFLSGRRDSNVFGAVSKMLENGDEALADLLLAYVRDNRDPIARSAAHVLSIRKEERMLPILSVWIGDPDKGIRNAAAVFLSSFLRGEEVVLPLIKAINNEKDTALKNRMINALARQQDKRSLETLMNEATRSLEADTLAHIAYGLVLLNDKKAIPTLAAMVDQAEVSVPDYRRTKLLKMVVLAFGQLSEVFETREPLPAQWDLNFANDLALEPGLSKLKQWRRAQR